MYLFKTDVGGIVGGIVGVIVVGVIVGVCVFRIKRRQRIDPISPNNVHIESTYDTDVTKTLPAPISPVYFELESYNNTSSTTTQLTSSDNDDVIVAKPSRRDESYDHIGVDVLTTDGDYNYLKGINSDKTTAAPDCNYNHVGLFTTEEDNYHHIVGNQSHFISEDTYSHIVGHNNTGLESDDYHHIGESHGHSNTGLDGGDYNHIGCGQELPSMVDIHYSVEDYSAIPDANAKDCGDISPFPDADTAGGIYSLAKRI
ncbi:hypothetical protein SNE40_020535 [Patella caerulea]|uniref:Uncharacterized protein n=1 Tax=Patella caerulea TaxID=87958 RepID=A0AAN8GE61_PATCE